LLQETHACRLTCLGTVPALIFSHLPLRSPTADPCLALSCAAFTPAAVPSFRGNTAVCANKFGQSAPQGAPAADLFNIWRDDYMLSPSEAAAEVRLALVFLFCDSFCIAATRRSSLTSGRGSLGMLHVSQAAARKANAFFDGVLPPFSNVGNTERGDILDAPTLRGIG